MTTYVEFHTLRAFPPSNLNRDDLGTPKTAIFGGARRLRISSQCLKRTWRMSEHFRGAFAEEQLGVRTDRMPEVVLKALDDSIDKTARDGLLALLSSIGKKSGKAASDEDDDDKEDDNGTDASATEVGPIARTAHLLFLSRQEIEAVGGFAKDQQKALGKLLKKNKVDADLLRKLRTDLRDYLTKHTSKNAVDVGLFGRFVTSDEFDTVDAALQVAHAIGTQKVEVEYDYFTAVDDLSHETGAGHLGESEFASSVLYLYACCDLAQLENNLGARGPDGRVRDAEAVALAKKSLPALVRAMAEATPKGKKNGTAPHTPADYIEVVVRRGSPLSLANAFAKPVDAKDNSGDVMAASIDRLTDYRDRIETAYNRSDSVIGRFVLQLRDEKSPTDGMNRMKSISELSAALANSLNTLESLEPA